MPIFSVLGTPGIGTTLTSTPTVILANTIGLEYLEGGRVIDGVNSGDWTNSTSSAVLNSGIILGKITATGLYAPTILGVLTAAQGGSQTTLTVSAAAATEISRRVGASGTLTIAGAASTGAAARTQTVTYSAVNTTTGVLTITALAAGAVSAVNQINSIVTVDNTGVGTFTITVEGITTAAITYSSTIATLISNINTQLNATFGTSAIVASGASLAALVLTFSGTGYTNRPVGAVTVTILVNAGGTTFTMNGVGTVGTPSVCPVTTAGVVAVAAQGGEYVSGSFVTATDGSGTPLALCENLYGTQVTDGFGNRQQTLAPRLVLAGHIISANIPCYSLLSAEAKTYLKSLLNSNGRHFISDDEY